MNSLMSEDLTRENLILETAKCLKEIFTNTQKADALHKEILEIDLSITAYVEESRKNLEALRLNLAKEATSSQEVVSILSDKCKTSTRMSSPAAKRQRMTKNQEDKTKLNERQHARSFIVWYKHMIDNERENLGLYLSDDAILEWFGRTIKNRKKVTSFLKFDMQCSRHDFTTVESIEKVELRSDRLQRKHDSGFASPQNSPEMIRSEGASRRKLFQSCGSPQWADGCEPVDNIKKEVERRFNGRKRLFSDDEVNSKGDGIGQKLKRKCIEDSTITPPNEELGQGDCCLPSTSTDSDRSHDTLNSQLPKLAVECNGYIEFTRSRNSRSSDSMKWDRKCKVQISYSEDPLNVGEYIIWILRYTDETKCRRNLLAAFEEVAKEEAK